MLTKISLWQYGLYVFSSIDDFAILNKLVHMLSNLLNVRLHPLLLYEKLILNEPPILASFVDIE